MKRDAESERQPTRVFLIGLVVGSTLGAAAFALVLAYQGAKFHSVYANIAGALLMGLLSALSASACSRNGRNSPKRTALWAIVGSLGIFIALALKDLFVGQSISSTVVIFELALGIVLTGCSTLAVWLAQKQSNTAA